MKGPDELRVGGADAAPALVYRARDAEAALVLAHGAGAGQRSPFMTAFARAIAALGIEVVTFDFPYMAARRRLPDRGPVLEAAYRRTIAAVQAELGSAGRFLFVGGKSMGGRIATQVAAADRGMLLAGLVLLGYPLHPPGRPQQLRAAHLPEVRRPMLIVQGSRDAFGTPDELQAALSTVTPPAVVHVVAGGDHSFKLAGRATELQAAACDDAQRTAVEWMRSVIAASRPSGR